MVDGRRDGGAQAREERARKVAAVMRENLRKRKAQERARDPDETGRPEPAVEPEGGTTG